MTGRSQPAEAATPLRRGLFRTRLRDARIRSKLGLILIIPVVAVIALAGVRLVDSGQRAIAAGQVQSLTAVAVEAADVANQLHLERTEAARFLARPDGDAATFNAQSTRTDQAVAGYDTQRSELGSVPGVVEDRLEQIDDNLAEIGNVRQQILGRSITTSATVLRYGVILTDVLAYLDAVSQVADDLALAEEIRAAAALSKAKTLAAEAEAIALVALADGEFSDEELTSFLATQTGQQEAFQVFSQTATQEQLAVAGEVITGGNVVFADRAAAAMLRSAGGELEISPAAATAAFRGLTSAARWVEEQLQQRLLASTTQQRDAVFQQVLFESVGVLLALIVAIVVAVLLARMLARSLGQLRQNALAVAERELPDTVARLSDPRTLGENTPAQLAAQVREPIQLRGRDEIGQVAQAFNVVHRAAVRVAAEQAALRTSVSAMFLNLARRSQSLVDRMISQLDEIERNEEDPKRLARMFTLDHLATRMRRNDENLLVLAGADSSPPRTEDALVTDVVRAAQSEVEHYDRIEFGTIDTDVSVVALAVNDTVRLVAELFDNATRFSPPDAAVVCEARRLGDQVIIQIEDRGVGMAQDQVNRLNAWLASPPAVEVTTFRKMGLAVVARLAARHQIRVELRCDPNYGTIAYVALPRSILVLPRSRMRTFEVPAPRSPMPVEQAPAPVPAAAAPPVPSRHLGQLPRRSAAVAHHAASRRSGRGGREEAEFAAGNGQAANHNHTDRRDMPVAGRPLYELTTQQQQHAAPATGSAVNPPPEATVELPIFREMEAVWFRSHGNIDLGREAEVPSAGGYPAPAGGQPVTVTAAANPPPLPPRRRPAGGDWSGQPTQPGYEYEPDQATAAASAPTSGSAASSTSTSASASTSSETWHTAADFGWRAAAAAARPTSGGSTQSGLPKRVPQAQLVPGSVDTPAAGGAQRRSPEEIRGLLSAYHRGVQRGRESGGR